MAPLTVFAPAKINLHLEVLGLRSDGYHELAMLMQSLDLGDQLTMAPTADGRIHLACDRAELPTDAGNLVVRAAELLKARAGLPELGARIQLLKRIPIGAGLAGGATDGDAHRLAVHRLAAGRERCGDGEAVAERGAGRRGDRDPRAARHRLRFRRRRAPRPRGVVGPRLNWPQEHSRVQCQVFPAVRARAWRAFFLVRPRPSTPMQRCPEH